MPRQLPSRSAAPDSVAPPSQRGHARGVLSARARRAEDSRPKPRNLQSWDPSIFQLLTFLFFSYFLQLDTYHHSATSSRSLPRLRQIALAATTPTTDTSASTTPSTPAGPVVGKPAAPQQTTSQPTSSGPRGTGRPALHILVVNKFLNFYICMFFFLQFMQRHEHEFTMQHHHAASTPTIGKDGGRAIDEFARSHDEVTSMAKNDDMQKLGSKIHNRSDGVQKSVTEIEDKVQHTNIQVDNIDGRFANIGNWKLEMKDELKRVKE